MANTYTLIEKIVVGAAGATSVTFTSIPQTYTDLKIVCTGRAADNGVADGFGIISFNGTTTGFSSKQIQGSGSAVTSASPTYRNAGIVGTAATANTFSSVEFYIPNYTSSNNKSYSVESVTENNATEAYAGFAAGLWSNTAAITSVTLADDTKTIFQYSSFYLYGIAKEGVTPGTSSAPYATGGDSIVFDGTYWIHTFTSSGTFTPKKGLTCDYLVVAGGGGGGTNNSGSGGGGGGAGGLRSSVTATGGGGTIESSLNLTAGTSYTVTVGAGGAGHNGTSAFNGSDSTFSTITSIGGGKGGGVGSSGGSGGGGGGNDALAGGAGTANQGYAGGASASGSGIGAGGGGGAGGVGTAGGTGGSVHNGGAGGAGVSVSITGSSVAYAGGGGGSSSNSGGTGGSATAGGGAGATVNANGTNGTANTGGGGGGARQAAGYTPGTGGSGVVIVRYAA